MGVLLAYIVGWTVGSKAGPKAFREVNDAVWAVVGSEEFEALVAIGRTHLASALHELSKMVSGETPVEPTDLLDRVQQLAARRPT